MINVTGHIAVSALAGLVHSAPAANGIAYSVTLQNIRECVLHADSWFVEPVAEGYRVFTDSGFSARVPNKSFLTFNGRTLCEAI